MRKHEAISWDHMQENDEIRTKLKAVQVKLEAYTKDCFQEKGNLHYLMTKQRKISRKN